MTVTKRRKERLNYYSLVEQHHVAFIHILIDRVDGFAMFLSVFRFFFFSSFCILRQKLWLNLLWDIITWWSIVTLNATADEIYSGAQMVNIVRHNCSAKERFETDNASFRPEIWLEQFTKCGRRCCRRCYGHWSAAYFLWSFENAFAFVIRLLLVIRMLFMRRSLATSIMMILLKMNITFVGSLRHGAGMAYWAQQHSSSFFVRFNFLSELIYEMNGHCTMGWTGRAVIQLQVLEWWSGILPSDTHTHARRAQYIVHTKAREKQ